MPDLVTYKGHEYYVTKKRVFVVFGRSYRAYNPTMHMVINGAEYREGVRRELKPGKLRTAVRREAVRQGLVHKEQ